MRNLNDEHKQNLNDSLASSVSFLGKLKKSRSAEYLEETIDKSDLEAYESDGYTYKPSTLKKQVKVEKKKDHFEIFENKCWCLLYDLGFRILNKNSKFILPYGPGQGEKQQIDVVAINDDVVILIECKSSEELTQKDHRPYIDTLERKIAGFSQSVKELLGEKRRVKFIFATNNQKIGKTNIDILDKSGVFYLNNNTFEYLTNLVKTYKNSAHYQFMSILFKGQIIKNEKIKIPAIKGKMGGHTYYMFSIEPEILIRISFVLHRVKANSDDNPNYQRLLDNKRIKSLSKYINEGGYFPNSIILNFSTIGLKKIQKLEWEDARKNDDSNSKHGILKIPNSYAIAYIIDGQHRVYGYSYSDIGYGNMQTIPVLAFENLSNDEQLKIFMDINQNQKAISRNLKETLKEDLYWNDESLSKKIEALRSGINNYMGTGNDYEITKHLSIGEDESEITMGAVIDGIKDSGFLPKVSKSELIDDLGVIYKVGVQEHNLEMNRVKKYLGTFLCKSFDYVITEFQELWSFKGGLLRSSRGAYAFIRTLGEINYYLSSKNRLQKNDTVEKRFTELRIYIDTLLDGLLIVQTNIEELEKVKRSYGAGTNKKWNHLFTSILNRKYSDFTTPDYEIYLETQDEEIQKNAFNYITDIETIIKERTLKYFYTLYGGEEGFKENEYDLFSLLRDNAERQNIEYKKVFNESLDIEWHQTFDIHTYGKLWEKGWGKELKDHNIKRLSAVLSVKNDLLSKDMNGESYYQCGKETNFQKGSKWLNKFNIIRRKTAHLGTRGKENGVNKEELNILRFMYNGLIKVSQFIS